MMNLHLYNKIFYLTIVYGLFELFTWCAGALLTFVELAWLSAF